MKIYEIDTQYVEQPIAKGKTIMKFVTLQDVINEIAEYGANGVGMSKLLYDLKKQKESFT